MKKIKTEVKNTKIRIEGYFKNLAFFLWFIFIFYITFNIVILIGGNLTMRLAALITLIFSFFGIITTYYLNNLEKKGLVWITIIVLFCVVYNLINKKIPYFSIILLVFILYGFKYYKNLK